LQRKKEKQRTIVFHITRNSMHDLFTKKEEVYLLETHNLFAFQQHPNTFPSSKTFPKLHLGSQERMETPHPITSLEKMG
jgi:hypothetical protein